MIQKSKEYLGCSMGVAIVLLGLGLFEICYGAEPPLCDRFDDPLPNGATARFGSVRLHDFSGLHCAEFSPDGSYLATGGGHGVIFWNLETGEELFRLETKSPVWNVKFRADGRALAIQTSEGVCVKAIPLSSPEQFWDIGRGKLLGVTRDGKQLVVGTKDSVRFLDAKTGNTIHEFIRDSRRSTTCYFHASSDTVAFVDVSGRIMLLKVGDKEPRIFCEAVRGECTSVTISTDGSSLAYLVEKYDGEDPSWERDGGYLDVFDIGSNKRTFRIITGLITHAHDLRIEFVPDGKLVAVSPDAWHTRSLRAGNTVVFRVAPNEVVARVKGSRASFSPNGKLLVGIQQSGVGLWRSPSIERCFAEFGHGYNDVRIIVSPNHRRIATCDEEFLCMWDVESGRQLWRHDLPATEVRAALMEFAGHGETLLVSRGNQFESLLTATGETIRSFPFNGRERPSVISHEGSKAISWSAQGAEIWQIGTGDPPILLRNFPNKSNATGITFSHDGNLVAGNFVMRTLSGPGQSMMIWNAATGVRLLSQESTTRLETNAIFLGDHLLLTILENPVGKEYGAGTLVVREVLTGGICDEIALDDNGVFVGATIGPGAWMAVARTGTAESTRVQNILAVDGPDFGTTVPRSTDEALFVRSRGLLLGVHSGEILSWRLQPTLIPATGEELSDSEFTKLWADLGGDARTAWKAIKALVQFRDDGISLLEAHLRVTRISTATIQSLIEADLQAESVEARRNVLEALLALGPAAATEVKRARETVEIARVRDDLDFVLERWSSPMVTDQIELRRLRSIQILELVGTNRAIQCLHRIAEGPLLARETTAAKRALERVEVARPDVQH